MRSFVAAQPRSVFPADHDAQQQSQVDYRAEWIKQLAANEKLTRNLNEAKVTIVQLETERDTSQKLQAVTRAERESLERSIAIAERIMQTQEKAIAIYERAITTQAQIIEKQGQRVEKLEDNLDRANRRTVVAGLGGFAVGIITSIIKIF